MDNVSVSRTQSNSTWGNWSYSPLKYWPKGNDEYRLSFFAYSPYKTNDNGIAIDYSSDKGSPTLKYTIPTTGVSNHQDILFAPITQNKEITKETNSYTTDRSTVKFHFYHALSRIGFKVKAADDYTGATISVNSISIVGKFEKEGTMNLATASADNTSNNPGWTHTTNTTEDVTYSVSVDSGTQISSSGFTSFSDNFIMTFPKYFDGYRLTINVNYTVSYSSPQSLSIENNVSVPISQAIDFHAGKAYTFNLVIGLDAINFTADVEAWPTETVISL